MEFSGLWGRDTEGHLISLGYGCPDCPGQGCISAGYRAGKAFPRPIWVRRAWAGVEGKGLVMFYFDGVQVGLWKVIDYHIYI